MIWSENYENSFLKFSKFRKIHKFQKKNLQFYVQTVFWKEKKEVKIIHNETSIKYVVI